MVTVPLSLLTLQDNGFHLLVEVILFNKTFTAVLDTGASKTVFDKTAVEKLLDKDEELQYSDVLSSGLGTTSMQSFVLDIPELYIGNWCIKNYEVAIIDLSSINYAYQQLELEPVIGVIGGDILHAYGAVIDYRKMTLRLRERKIKHLI